MSIKNKYFTGTTVSRYLSPSDASWDENVYQSGKPVLDSELNLSQEVNRHIGNLIQSKEVQSGFLRGPGRVGIETSPRDLRDFYFPPVGHVDFAKNSFRMPKLTALVANMPIVVEYSDIATSNWNKISLSTAPVNGGTPPDVKRTDFVFLEVFKAMVAPSPHGTGTIEVADPSTVTATDTITLAGVALTAVAGVPAADEFQIGATPVITASNIASAINLSTNSFTTICTASVDPTNTRKVNLRSVAGGVAGNITFVSSDTAALIPVPLTGNFAGGVDKPNKPTQDTIYIHGNVKAPTGVNLADNIEDPVIGTESTQRVQNQYRIRATGQDEAVNFKTENGFSNSEVVAQGTLASPNINYRFVPADGESVIAFLTVLGTPFSAGDTIVINGTTLTGVSGARTSGSNDFDVTVAGITAMATEISNAINDPANSFVAFCSATTSSSQILITPVSPASNIEITTTVDPASLSFGVSSAPSYAIKDQGLFIAGNGTAQSAADLGTVDGYVYAIPIAFVFRRNDATSTGGFAPLNNTNGALASDHAGVSNTHLLSAPLAIPPSVSDRPDQRFHDAIVEQDVLDLRRSVCMSGVDLKAELERQMTLLLDGNLRTWAIDSQDKGTLGAGSGDVSWRFLVCNEIGRDGGTAPIAGDTTRGDLIGNFDHIRRRFGDQAVVERRVFPIMPDADSATEPGKYVVKGVSGHVTWTENDVIHIDLDNLNATGLGDWSHASSTLSGGVVSNYWPAGTRITDVLTVIHDDGHTTSPITQTCEVLQVLGVGTSHVEIKLCGRNSMADGGNGSAAYPLVVPVATGTDTGSPRAIFVELEITYPVGSGSTDTPDEVLQPATVTPMDTVYKGSCVENDQSTRPTDMETLLPPMFREGKREIYLDYEASLNNSSHTPSGSPIVMEVVSSTNLLLGLPRRIYGSASGTTPVIEDISSGVPVAKTCDTANTTFGSSKRLLAVDSTTPLSFAQTLTRVSFYAQDPIPNYGGSGSGYQVAVYYRSNAPQTLATQTGVVPLPTNLTLQPLVMSRSLWSNTISVGSNDLPFPYTNPSDQIAVNEELTTGANPDFPGEWVLQATAKISVSDFDAETGLLNLHQLVAADPNADLVVSDVDKDNEFRAHYKVADSNSYRPTAYARNLSGVATHKCWFPMLAQSTIDSVFFRKGEVLLVVVSRFAKLDENNAVAFIDTSTSGIKQQTCVAIYRTSGILILASEK